MFLIPGYWNQTPRFRFLVWGSEFLCYCSGFSVSRFWVPASVCMRIWYRCVRSTAAYQLMSHVSLWIQCKYLWVYPTNGGSRAWLRFPAGRAFHQIKHAVANCNLQNPFISFRILLSRSTIFFSVHNSFPFRSGRTQIKRIVRFRPFKLFLPNQIFF